MEPQTIDRHPLLLHRIALAHGGGLVLEGVGIDRYAKRRADLVHAAVAAADGPALVVKDPQMWPQILGDLVRDIGHAVAFDQRQDRRLDRRNAGMEAHHHALVTLDLLLVVGLDQAGHAGARSPYGGLNHIGHELVAAFLVEVLELLAREFLVAR